MSVVMQINPFDFFTNADGDALDAGFVFIGEPNKDPRQYPAIAYFDAAGTIPAPMPLRTSNGYIVRNGSPTFLYISGNYSILVQDNKGRQIYYVPDFLMVGTGSAVNTADLANNTDPTKGSATVGFAPSGTGAVGRTVQDKLRELGVNAADFGAIPNTSTSGGAQALANANAIQASIDALNRDGRHILPDGIWVVSRPINFNKGFEAIDWTGCLVASDDFVGDYLVVITPGGSENFYRWPLRVLNFNINCRYKTRGVSMYNMDHLYMANPRIEASLGRGMMIDKIRESNLVFPLFVNCAHRDNFTSPANWSSATSYSPGDRARVVDDPWSGATAYVPDDCVRESGRRYICLFENTADQPSTNPLKWKLIPHEDYLCVVANSNKDPQINNTNAALLANRVWQKIYQDEATLELVDYTLDGSDRSNQIVLESPVIRDCGNKCFVRVDSSKLPSRPVTHFDVFGGHFHGLAAQQAGIVPELPIPDLQRCVEIGYGINTNIYSSNIRCGDGDDCISVMYGDGGTTKLAQDMRIRDCALSGDGARDIGMLVMPSARASLSAVLEVAFLITDVNGAEMHDPRRVFRKTIRTEQRTLLPPGLNGVVGGVTILNPVGNGIYSDVRPYSYQNEGEAGTRYDVQVTPNRTAIRAGSGDNTYVEWRWDAANPTRMTLNPSRVLAIPGTWDFPFIMASARLWVQSGGNLRIKNGSDPTSDTDGVVVGTQT